MPCPCLLKSGPREGQPCGRPSKGGTFCVKHTGCNKSPTKVVSELIRRKYQTAELMDHEITIPKVEYSKYVVNPMPEYATVAINQPVTIIKRLGEGNFGSVDLVRHYKYGECAMKTVKNNASSHDEINIFKYLDDKDCPWNIKLFGYVELDTKIILYMEHYNGVELAKLHINLSVPGDIDRWLFYTYELIKAVKCLHRIGVMHRDIKPANILVNGNSLKLIDFGMSCVFSKCSATIKGTPNFFAPEMFKLEKRTLIATDIWAVGATMYTIAYGKAFYNASSIQDLKLRMGMMHTLYDVERVLDQPSTLSKDMVRRVKMVLFPLLEPNPSQRIENFARLTDL